MSRKWKSLKIKIWNLFHKIDEKSIDEMINEVLTIIGEMINRFQINLNLINQQIDSNKMLIKVEINWIFIRIPSISFNWIDRFQINWAKMRVQDFRNFKIFFSKSENLFLWNTFPNLFEPKSIPNQFDRSLKLT